MLYILLYNTLYCRLCWPRMVTSRRREDDAPTRYEHLESFKHIVWGVGWTIGAAGLSITWPAFNQSQANNHTMWPAFNQSQTLNHTTWPAFNQSQAHNHVTWWNFCFLTLKSNLALQWGVKRDTRLPFYPRGKGLKESTACVSLSALHQPGTYNL